MRRFSIVLTALVAHCSCTPRCGRNCPGAWRPRRHHRSITRMCPDCRSKWCRTSRSYPPTMNLGETLGVAVNSKGDVVVLNHPGSPTTGPLYGNATTQLLVFDRSGKFVKEIGQGACRLGYAHAVRFDRYDNLWVVDKGTNAVMKFNPAGYVTMNLGRRPEGYEGEYHRPEPEKAVPVDGLFNGPTDIAWDANDNIYISEGYVNNRIAKFDKNGNWVKTWGQCGEGGEHANRTRGTSVTCTRCRSIGRAISTPAIVATGESTCSTAMASSSAFST